MFDSIIGDPGYLYSWQDRDTTKNEFTIINDDGELGLKIFYFILDKKDSLLSWTQIGGKGSEGGYWFETRSKFINPDTLLNIGAITQWLDFDNKERMTKTKGDSTFSYHIIDKTGKVTGKVLKEVKELNFDNDYSIQALPLTLHLCYVGGLKTPLQLCATISFRPSPTI